MDEPTKILVITQQEAEMILDMVRVSNPITRSLALKVAGVVLEYAALQAVRDAQEQIEQALPVLGVR